jgi:sugar phosphate permease
MTTPRKGGNTGTAEALKVGGLRRAHYAWVVAAVTFVALMGAAGFRATPSILIVPLQHEFGWNRAIISIAVSINLVLFGLMGPFAAALMDRFGIRTVTVGALLTVATGALLTTRMTSPWQLYLLWGVVVGLGTGCMASVLAATVAGRWFVKRRGLVVGALTAAGATGQLIFLPALGWLAQDHGWRTVSIAIAVAAAAVVPLVAVFLRNRPSDLGLRAYGATEADSVPLATGSPIKNAFRGLGLGVRSRDFWFLAGSFFICGASTNGLIGTHLIPASMDHGMAEVTAASLLAVIGVFDVVGTLASGYLTDRFDSRWLLFTYYGLRGLSLLLLPYVFGSPQFGLILFIVFYGLDWVATVPPTVQLARKTFGQQNFAIVYGWIFAAHQLGAASIAFAAGAVRTYFGDYQLAFMSSGLLCLIAAGMVLRIGRDRPAVPVEVKRPADRVEAPAYT